MVSMKDIAQRCGVSIATVSKALNDAKDISEERKELIRKMAAEMGYMANSAARTLKTNRTYNIGVLFVDERQSGLTHDFFSAVLESVKTEAEAQGYDITFINRNIGRKETRYLQHCRYRNMDGVVIANVDFKDPQVAELIDSDIPVVTIDYQFNNHIGIFSDNVNGTGELVKYAYDMGHRKIAFIHGETTDVTQKRLTGFYRACEDLGLRIPDEYVREGKYHETESCAQLTAELIELPDPPTCILFPDDFSAVGGYNELARHGMKIPEDISVMGYDGIMLASILGPPLTTYHQNTKELGSMAAARLIEQIEHPKTTILDQTVVNGNLQIGGSVAEI